MLCSRLFFTVVVTNLCIFFLSSLAQSQPIIADFPDKLDTIYDIQWQFTASAPPAAPWILEWKDAAGAGYQIALDGAGMVWTDRSDIHNAKTQTYPFALPLNSAVTLSVKCRRETMALLCNHRLVFTAAMSPASPLQFLTHNYPASFSRDSARYLRVEPRVFGDDFKRPDGLARFAAAQSAWYEDDCWTVAHYRSDFPGSTATDARTGIILTNPWQLTLFPMFKTSVNGFWMAYTGVGASWLVVNPALMADNWDRYRVQAAVQPEYDSVVGVIAAYQDNQNYLLLRWRAREALAGVAAPARLELVAEMDGAEHLLASSSRGFAPGQWYTLGINLGWRQVQAMIDGVVVLQATNPGAIEGRVGLFALGAQHPHRAGIDAVTAAMYVTKDQTSGLVINDAAEALRSSSCLYFDNVSLRDWEVAEEPTGEKMYPTRMSGQWASAPDGTLSALAAGDLLTGPSALASYVLTGEVRIPAGGIAGFVINADGGGAELARREPRPPVDLARREPRPPGDGVGGAGYYFRLSAHEQALYRFTGTKLAAPADRAALVFPADTWLPFRLVVDGGTMALTLNGVPVLDYFDAGSVVGQVGFRAEGAGAAWRSVAMQPYSPDFNAVQYHKNFASDRWLVTWASPEADWYPVVIPKDLLSPAGAPLFGQGMMSVGAAGPLPTNVPGLYWHKGGHYHDFRVTLPISPTSVHGQIVHLSANDDAVAGYRIILDANGDTWSVRLVRQWRTVAHAAFPFGKKPYLIIERRGSYYLVSLAQADPEQERDQEAPVFLSSSVLIAFRDAQPLPAYQIGFTVTTPSLPAAAVVVESDRKQETFETAPVDWVTQSGVWQVMNRYTCQPQWNWFGGFGAGEPTLWSKHRLQGNQTVEAYMGIKMQFDNAEEEYARRYRDVNMSICADGEHLNSGYSVIRAGRADGQVVSMLLRQGAIVKTSSNPAHLLPPQGVGHRQWFATRIEKRGAQIRVYFDNLLAMTYDDPAPLRGGYIAFWTLDNGIMLGRINYSAEAMPLGAPHAAAPLGQQADLPPLPTPRITLNGTALDMATFASGLDGIHECAGHFAGRLQRERVSDAYGTMRNYLKVINSYPAGDASVALLSAPRDLKATALLQFDYCLTPATKVNLYARVQDAWYRIQCNGDACNTQEFTQAGKQAMQSDGAWHHCALDLDDLLKAAIKAHTGAEPPAIQLSELVLAEWETAPALRQYGFGQIPGGSWYGIANVAWLPRLTAPATLTWQDPTGQITHWRACVDTREDTTPTTDAAQVVVQPAQLPCYVHLQGQLPDGAWGPIYHLFF